MDGKVHVYCKLDVRFEEVNKVYYDWGLLLQQGLV